MNQLANPTVCSLQLLAWLQHVPQILHAENQCHQYIYAQKTQTSGSFRETANQNYLLISSMWYTQQPVCLIVSIFLTVLYYNISYILELIKSEFQSYFVQKLTWQQALKLVLQESDSLSNSIIKTYMVLCYCMCRWVCNVNHHEALV